MFSNKFSQWNVNKFPLRIGTWRRTHNKPEMENRRANFSLLLCKEEDKEEIFVGDMISRVQNEENLSQFSEQKLLNFFFADIFRMTSQNSFSFCSQPTDINTSKMYTKEISI